MTQAIFVKRWAFLLLSGGQRHQNDENETGGDEWKIAHTFCGSNMDMDDTAPPEAGESEEITRNSWLKDG